jgi:AraC-like DNA-binding protein
LLGARHPSAVRQPERLSPSARSGARLRASQLAPEHRYAAFREVTRPVFDSLPLCDERAFDFSAEAYPLADLLPLRMAYGPHLRIRGARQARTDATEQIAVRFHLRGRTAMRVGDHPALIGTDQVYLYDVRHEMRFEVSAGETLGVVIPYRRIDLAPFKRTPVIVWPVASPKGRILTNAVMTLWDELPGVPPAEAEDLAAGLAGLINGLLASQRTPEEQRTVERAALAAMLAHVDRHLHDLSLGAAALCQRFNCSRSHLYALFRPFGGVERYIRDQRLERCFTELLDSPPQRGRITALVEKWGFEDHSHLHRAFRARFGIAPSDVVARGSVARPLPTGPGAIEPAVGRLQRWLGRL